MTRARYFLLALFILLFASCAKNQDDSIVDTRFTYTNTTLYTIDINLYVKSLETIQFSYTIRPNDSLSLDFRSVGGSANPFGAPEVDSAEVVFDDSRKLIYSLKGDNGENKPHNIFYLKNTSYTLLQGDPKSYRYKYEFTNTDYFNAR